MPINNCFCFKQFTINQDKCAMKIGTDSVLLGAWVNCNKVQNVLDIGTGTGVLALMVAQKCNANITAIEIDDIACKQAEENKNNSLWASRIKVVNISLQKFVSNNEKFDFIISNPPFFTNSLKSPIKYRTVARHSDTLSLNEIVSFSKNNLSLNGKLAIILPIVEGNEFVKLALAINLFCIRKCLVKPNPIKEPHRMLLEFSFIKQITQESEIVIENGTRHHYTEEYKKLTEDFYLSFKY